MIAKSSSSWSPDGKYLAAACGQNINVISISDGKIIQMGMNCLDGCLNVQWSPDGKWLSYGEGDYMAPKESGLFLISTDCLAQPQTCFEQKRGPFSPNYNPPADFPGWSPDGKFLVIPVNSPGEKLVLEFLNVQTGAIERKMQPPNAFVFAIDAMAWSPDGEWIAYAQQLLNVDITRTQGGTPVELVNTPNERIKILQWISIPYPFAPGSVYSITSAGANLNLRAQPALDGQVAKRLLPGEAVTILEGPTQADGYTWWRMRTKDGIEGWAADIPDWYAPQVTATLTPTVSPSLFDLKLFSSLKPGQYLIYASQGHPFGIISANGRESIDLAMPPLWSRGVFLSLSPDRKKLAFIISNGLEGLPGARNKSLMVLDLVMGNAHHLMDETICSAAAWSPDGTRLAAACYTSIYLFSLTSGEKMELPAHCGGICGDVNWSPDGKWISYQTAHQMDTSKMGVFWIGISCPSQTSNCLTSDHGRLYPLYDPAPYTWSPDGKYIAMADPQIQSAGEVVLKMSFLNIQTGEVERSFEIPGFHWQELLRLAWSPDGKWIGFIQNDGIYKVPVEGGSPTLVAHLKNPYIGQWINFP